MGNCQNVFQIENEIDFNSTIIKDKLNYQKLNKSIIIEYKYSKYHHPIPIMTNSDIKNPYIYYKNKSPPSSFQNNEKFTDEIFPPNLHSLTYISDYNKEYVETSEITDFNNITWKRITEIFKNNKFDLFNTLDVDDIRQGIIGNCYFLCVLSSFAKRPEIYDKIFIDKKIKDNGLYKLRFIINGIPQIILVDDYFPTVNNKFIFAQSTNEFWVQLLEKAWAKVNLSYANTIAGVPYEVFNCLSEAPCENISHIRHDKYYVWNQLIRAKKHGFYITCNTKYLSKEQEDNEGLISGHSYAIIDLYEFNILYKQGTIYESDYTIKNYNFNCSLKKIEINNDENKDNNNVLKIVKIYNPWAWFEWKGKFNDNDTENWNRIPLLKKLVGYNNNDDGIFFMEFSDYYKKFHSTYILNYLKDWVYNYKIINQKSNDYVTCVKLILQKENKIRFGLHVKQSRINLMENNSSLYPITLIIAKYNSEFSTYKLINSVYDVTDNIFSTYYENFQPGEYHIFMHYNADSSKVSDYNYTLSTYSKEKVDLLDFEDYTEIPNNYMYQIINCYIIKKDKEFDSMHKDINYYFDNSDNNLGIYFINICNKSKLYYLVELDFDCTNCELVQDEYVMNYFCINDLNSNKFKIRKYLNDKKKLKKIKQEIKCLLKPGENKIFIWKLKANIRSCSLIFTDKKFVIYDKKNKLYDINILYFENLSKHEMMHNFSHDLEKKVLNEDLEYSEVENNEYIFLIMKNHSKIKNYLIEFSFIELIDLKIELIKDKKNKNGENDEKYCIIFYPGKIQIINLKKKNILNKDKYDFTIEYSILPI